MIISYNFIVWFIKSPRSMVPRSPISPFFWDCPPGLPGACVELDRRRGCGEPAAGATFGEMFCSNDGHYPLVI